MKPTLLESILAARKCGTPILAVISSDQQACLKGLAEALNGDAQVAWDCVRGLRGINSKGTQAVAGLGNPADVQDQSRSLPGALVLALKFPEDTVLYAYNADRHLNDPDGVQAVSNLRERFKEDGRCLIMLAPGFQLPPALQTDVVVLEEALPGDEVLASIVQDLYVAGKIGKPADELLAKAVPAGRGLAAFAAEQAYALSMKKEGLDIEAAWERKKAAINQVPGLTLSIGGPTFKDLGGLHSIRQYAERLFAGPERPELILRLDEVEKQIGSTGYSGDGGVGKDAIGAWLRAMEDNGWSGLIAVGPPGTAKTAVSRAFGSTYGVPEIAGDLGAMKGGIVGESERLVRQALRVVYGLGGPRVFVFATCNHLEALPPELRRRFWNGTWYFDLPTKEEKPAIWELHRKAENVNPKAALPDDTDWTGAEIRNCCKLARRLNLSPQDAAHYIIPVARGAAESIDRLRALADGRFLSASYQGVYTKDHTVASEPETTGRRIR